MWSTISWSSTRRSAELAPRREASARSWRLRCASRTGAGRRGGDGDDRLAADAEAATALACRAAIRAGTADEWARPTLLGVAFGRGDVQDARALLQDVKREGAVAWQLESTVNDLLESVAQ